MSAQIFLEQAKNRTNKSGQYKRTLIAYEQCNEESIDELLNWCKSIFEDKIENILTFTKENNKNEIKLYIYIKFNRRTRVNKNRLIYRNFKPDIKGITKGIDNLIKNKLIKKEIIN